MRGLWACGLCLTGLRLVSAIPINLYTSNNSTTQDYGNSLDISCQWNLDHESLNNQYNIADDESIELTWKFNHEGFYEFKYNHSTNDYQGRRRSHGTRRNGHSLQADPKRYSVDFDYASQTSTLTILAVEIVDSGMFSCGIEFATAKKGSTVYGISHLDINVVSEPDVGCVTEQPETPIDVRSYELEQLRQDTEVIEHQDRHVATCKVREAFPKPDAINFIIGENSEEPFVFTIPADQEFRPSTRDELLFDLDYEVFLTYGALSENAEQLNSEFVKCSVSDSEGNWEAVSEPTDERIEVQYLPNRVELRYKIDNSDSPDIERDNVLIASEGSDIVGDCVSNGNPTPDYFILPAEDKKLDDSYNYTEYQGRNDLMVLSEISITRHDEIENFCLVKVFGVDDGFKLVSETKKLEVRYLDAPTLTVASSKHHETSEASVIEVHQKATLTCAAQSSQPPLIEFFKDDVLISQRNESNNFLEIDSSSYEDAGSYHCSATNQVLHKESSSKSLKVHGPCVITSSEIQKNVKVGADGEQDENVFDIKFICQIDTKVRPECRVSWRYDQSVYGQAEESAGHDGKYFLVMKDFQMPARIADYGGDLLEDLRNNPDDEELAAFRIFAEATNSYTENFHDPSVDGEDSTTVAFEIDLERFLKMVEMGGSSLVVIIIVLVVIILLVLIALVGFLFYKQKQDKKEGTEMGDVQDSNPKEAGTADAGGEFDGTMSRQGDNPQPQQATYYEVPRLVQEE